MGSLTLSIRRSLLSGTWNGIYSGALAIPKFKLPELVDGFFSRVLPLDVWSEKAIKDIKGRDQEQYITVPTSNRLKARAEEIAFVAGKVFESDRTSYPFTLSLLSKFSAFDGHAHILHKLEIDRSGEFADQIPFRNIGVALPIEISHFRFGLQLFAPRFFSMLGRAPVVTQSVLLECEQNECKFLMEVESLGRRDEIPFERDEIFKKIGLVLEHTLGMNIYRDYQERLA